MKKIIFILASFFLSYQVFADTYIVITTIKDFRKLDGPLGPGIYPVSTASFSAVRGSIFDLTYDTTSILGSDGNYYIAIDFSKAAHGSTIVEDDGSTYLIPRDEFHSNIFVQSKMSFAFGALTVPFKLRFSPSVISASADLGPYIGVRLRMDANWSVAFVATVGLDVVALNDVNSTTPQNVVGLTYGGGAVFAYRTNVQIGALVGADVLGGGVSWPYENKPWLAIATGFAFLK